jgi:outer membrane protein TolC
MRKFFHYVAGFTIPLLALQVTRVVVAGPTSGTRSSRVFTLDRAIKTALDRNPDILRAKQEIERTKGVFIEVRAQALPHIGANSNFTWTDPSLGSRSFGGTTTGATATPTVNPTPANQLLASSGPVAAAAAPASPQLTDYSYNLSISGRQLIFDGSTVPAIRGASFSRDSSYFAFRNVLDQTISTVKQQFYQVLLNKALIGVQEQAVGLLRTQLEDQRNRFEAGTVPRFNVLQAEVALSNVYPQLITAQNNFRISQLQLAKTIGLDFDPARGSSAPLEAVGELNYTPRAMSLTEAIALAKQQRPFLKQARANVLNQREQVNVARGGYFPSISMTGGHELVSSPFSTNIHEASNGWFFGLTGSWAIWDSGQTYGAVKQQRALLEETEISYDDDVRQVELEVQQAYSTLQQNRELIQSQEKNVQQAEEAQRLAKARLDAGAGTQLEVLNAQVQLTTAQSTRLQAVAGYETALAEFDRVTATQTTYTESFDNLTHRLRRYDTPPTREQRTSVKSQPARPRAFSPKD